MTIESYSFAGHTCQITICNNDVLSKLPSLCGCRVVIVGDATVLAHYGAKIAAGLREKGASVHVLAIRPGEKSKNIATFTRLIKKLAAIHADRETIILGLGGGVSTDIAAFVAATYLRGLPLWLMPTSLLAMCDAAIGAKSALNLPGGKNLVGAFYLPERLYIEPSFLATLPPRQLAEGMAEIAKIAYICDEELFAKLEKMPTISQDMDRDIIERAIELKIALVSADNFDKGKRQLLNFGHTIGHALELAKKELSHGEAVAIGMVLAAGMAHKRGILPEADFMRLKNLLARLNLPLVPPVSFKRAARYLLNDKKRLAGQVRMVLPQKIGHPCMDEGAYTLAVTPAEIAANWP